MFSDHKKTCFWNDIKKIQCKRVNSTLKSQQFGDYYFSIMTDQYDLLIDEQNSIRNTVKQQAEDVQEYICNVRQKIVIKSDDVSGFICNKTK